MGVGDETAEKIVTIGFHCTGQITSKILFGALKKGWKLGGNVRHHFLGNNRESLGKLQEGGKQLSGFEVEKAELKGFDKYAKKYHVRYSLTKEKNDPTHYFFSYDARDTEKLEALKRDALKDKSHDFSGLGEKISEARERAFSINKSQEQSHDKHKSHHRERGGER